MGKGPSTLTRRLVHLCFGFYRAAVTPVLPTACRYYPSCSLYAEEAIQRHGLITGARLTLKRLARCHPFAAGGYDPVPGER
jgi:putative membrane protein insertion efficiency factor